MQPWGEHCRNCSIRRKNRSDKSSVANTNKLENGCTGRGWSPAPAQVFFAPQVGAVAVDPQMHPNHCGVALVAECAGLAAVVVFRELRGSPYAGMDLAYCQLLLYLVFYCEVPRLQVLL